MADAAAPKSEEREVTLGSVSTLMCSNRCMQWRLRSAASFSCHSFSLFINRLSLSSESTSLVASLQLWVEDSGCVRVKEGLLGDMDEEVGPVQ